MSKKPRLNKYEKLFQKFIEDNKLHIEMVIDIYHVNQQVAEAFMLLAKTLNIQLQPGFSITKAKPAPKKKVSAKKKK